MGLYEYDRVYYSRGLDTIAGIDEAGRGPLAGPLVAAAVILDPQKAIDGVDDSKKLSPKRREELFWDILCSALDIGIGIVDAGTIDRVNVYNATKLAMAKAVADLQCAADLLLIDAMALQDVPLPQVSIIKGDACSASIAAASIIAKVTRDRLMLHYHEQYPQYDFNSHKGYPTRKHCELILKYGPCEIHRKTFSPVKNLSRLF